MSENVRHPVGLAALDDRGLALRVEHAFDVRINFDKRWVFGPGCEAPPTRRALPGTPGGDRPGHPGGVPRGTRRRRRSHNLP